MDELKRLMTDDEAKGMGIDQMPRELRMALQAWGLRMFELGKHPVAEIRRIVFGGRLILLDDGTWWEVDRREAAISEGWDELDRVILIHDTMYRLDARQKVMVEARLSL